MRAQLTFYRTIYADGYGPGNNIGAWLRIYNIVGYNDREQYHFDKRDPLAAVPSHIRKAAATGTLKIEVEHLMDWHTHHAHCEMEFDLLKSREKQEMPQMKDAA